MRWVFISLLLFNVVYFGWEYDHQIKSDIKNAMLSQNIPSGARRLTLLTEQESPPQLLRSTIAMVKENTEITTKVHDSVNTGNAKDFNPESGSKLVTELPDINISDNLRTSFEDTLCFTFGPLPDEILATGLADWFRSRRGSTNKRYTDNQSKQLFMVYLSAQESRSNAIDIIRELKNKGVTDYQPLNRGNLQNAISLGLFSSQAAVNKRLLELEQKGYKPVVVPYNGEDRVYWVDVQFGAKTKLLDQVYKGYPSRYKSVSVNCSNIAMLMTKP